MLEVNPEHTSPIKTSNDHFTEFLVGIVKQKYKNLSENTIITYIKFLRGAYENYVKEKEIKKEQDRIVARDNWTRKHPFIPYNPHRTWTELKNNIFGGKKSHKRPHKRSYTKSHKRPHKK